MSARYALMRNATEALTRQYRVVGVLGDIHTIFDHSSDGQSPCPMVRDMIQQRIDENRTRLFELNNLQQRMDEALGKWKRVPDGEPDGDAICHLIESIK